MRNISEIKRPVTLCFVISPSMSNPAIKTTQFLILIFFLPILQVPAYEDADGTCLFESNAIAYHLATEELRGGKDAVQKALVQQWISFADTEVLPPACSWVFPVLGLMQQNKASTERAREDLTRVMSVLNAHLLHSTFLVGERVTLADIAVACNLLLPYKYVFDKDFR